MAARHALGARVNPTGCPAPGSADPGVVSGEGHVDHGVLGQGRLDGGAAGVLRRHGGGDRAVRRARRAVFDGADHALARRQRPPRGQRGADRVRLDGIRGKGVLPIAVRQ